MRALLGRLLVIGVCLPIPASASVVEASDVRVATISVQANIAFLSVSSSVHLQSGTSLTLSGADGYFRGASSITATSYLGEGTNLSSLIDLMSTQTYSGAATLASSITVRSYGREILISTSASPANIKIDSAGIISFYPDLHASSATIISGYSTTNQQFTECVTGSTLTIITSGGRVEIAFTGTFTMSTGLNFGVSFMQDGLYPNGLTATKGVVTSVNRGPVSQTQSFKYLLAAPSPGTHSYCISIRNANASAATVTLYDNAGLDSNNQLGQSTGRNLFYVKEIK